jgi:hypothetical protein
MNVIERIRETIDFPALVGETIPLPRYPDGKPVLVRCPFHDDHRPSLAVYNDHAHCFGCGWHGDAFTWVMQRDGLSFRQALEALAQRAGIPLRALSPEEQQKAQERRQYEEALGLVARHFARRLQETPRALEYARGRAWTDETIRAEGIGYADGSPLPLLGHPQAQAVADALNRWAGRVGGAIVYAHRQGGRVVYLSGRSVEGKEHYNPPTEQAGPRMPYCNALYSPRVRELVIVEGQACAITLGGWGIPALALAGSGLTENLAELLARHRQRETDLYAVPDGDGKTDLAALARAAGPLLRVVTLPEGAADVNAYAQSGASAGDFRALLSNAPAWLDLQIEQAKRLQGAERDRAVENLFSLLADHPLPPVTRDRYIRQIARDLDLQEQTIRRRLYARLDGMTERYTVQDGCICALREGDPRPLCNFTAEITEDVARDDGETVTRFFTVRGRLADGTPLPPIRVESDRFEKMAWVTAHWGTHAVIRAGATVRDQVREAIQLRSTSVTPRYVYTHTGWQEIDGKRVYLTASGALGLDGVAVELDRDLDRYRLPTQPEDPAGAMRASLRFLAVGPETVTVPFWAAVYLAPIAEILYPAFVLWAYGVSGAMKSTLAALALSHYGSFTDRDLFLWGSTRNYLEKLCFLAKDALLVIDDFCPQSDPHRAREMEQNAAHIVRAVGNRAGRGRLAGDLSLRTVYRPRALVLSTGELVPEGFSETARILTVEMRRGDVDLDRLTDAQAEADRYPHALAGYILWLAENWAHLDQTLPQEHRNFRAGLMMEYRNYHLRVSDTLATLYLGFHLGLTYAVEVGALGETEEAEWRERGWAALKACAEAQAQRVERERPTLLFLQVLSGLVAQGKAKLYPKGNKEYIPEPGTELLGWYDDDYIYLLPEASYHLVARYLREEGRHFPVRENTLRKYLAEEGYLERGDEEHYTSPVRTGGKLYRTFRVHREKVKEYFDLSQSEESASGIPF